MPFNTRTSVNTRTRGFSNSRDWRSFLSGAQAYANVATALEAGHAWLTGRVRAQGQLRAGLVGSASVAGKTVRV